MGEATSDYFVHQFVPAPRWSSPRSSSSSGSGGSCESGLSERAVLVGRGDGERLWHHVCRRVARGTRRALSGVGTLVRSRSQRWSFSRGHVEGTLSIHSITSTRRELFYWTAITATFALGTATGDLTATTSHLGYFGSGLLFTGLFVLPAIGYRLFNLNAIGAFWASYVLTRPMGASYADWLGVSRVRGGLNWETVTFRSCSDSAIVLTIVALLINQGR